MRHWSDETGAVCGWQGPERYEGLRTYEFEGITEEDLAGATIVHRRWANAVLILADGQRIEESNPHEIHPREPAGLLVSVEGTGPPEVA
jgi:hypothetical protein